MDGRALLARLRAGGRTALARRFGIDARALAAFRIWLGGLVLADLLLRSRDLVAFYTDSGVLPRSLLREQFPVFARVSLHALSGSAWVQALLFALAGGCALALLVGYRTRIATLASFVLLVSLHARNPLVLNAGDSLLRRLLFWAAFLPLGERWSLDALRTDRERPPDRRVATVASAALLVQVVVVYTANAAFKLRGERWLRGEAIRYALSLDQLTLALGDALTRYPLVLEFLDRTWLGMIVSSVLLLLLVGRPRGVFASLFVAMHVGMALTMRLGIFPFVSIAALLAFLPPGFWDEVAKRRHAAAGRRVEAAFRRFDEVASRRFERVDRDRLSDSVRATVARWTGRLQPPVVGGLLAAVLVWNAATLGLVGLPAGVNDSVDPAEYRWDMFAPEPRTTDGWYVVPGELASGAERDVFHGSAVRWDRPPDLARTYPNVRWFKYLVDLRRSGSDPVGHRLAGYLCERWNRTHATGVERVTVYYVEQPTRLRGPEPTERVRLLRHSCGPTDPSAS